MFLSCLSTEDFHIKSLPLRSRLLASCHADQTHARRHKPFFFSHSALPFPRTGSSVGVKTVDALSGNLSKCNSDVSWNVNEVDTSKVAQRKMYILSSSSPPPSSFSYIKRILQLFSFPADSFKCSPLSHPSLTQAATGVTHICTHADVRSHSASAAAGRAVASQRRLEYAWIIDAAESVCWDSPGRRLCWRQLSAM